ncbi:MAG: hypothetical protein FWH51_04015 [Dehalococcoidia bacterium]|nr:hypothetical protein [Dehalococcoidia bacterium]
MGEDAQKQPPPPLVEYRVDGAAESALIAFSNSWHKTERHAHVLLPCSFQFVDFFSDLLEIEAQNEGDSGSVMVSIYYKGRLVASKAKAGPYKKVKVSAKLYRP